MNISLKNITGVLSRSLSLASRTIATLFSIPYTNRYIDPIWKLNFIKLTRLLINRLKAILRQFARLITGCLMH